MYDCTIAGEYCQQEAVCNMVKGISRQVIVVQSPEPKMFEQAIFILKDGQTGVTEETLLKEARKLINASAPPRKARYSPAPMWAFVGALATGIVWLISAFV